MAILALNSPFMVSFSSALTNDSSAAVAEPSANNKSAFNMIKSEPPASKATAWTAALSASFKRFCLGAKICAVNAHASPHCLSNSKQRSAASNALLVSPSSLSNLA